MVLIIKALENPELKANHEHLGVDFPDNDSMVGKTSINEGHSHPIGEMTIGIDPQTQAPITIRAALPMPNMGVNHWHPIEDYYFKPKKKPEKKIKIDNEMELLKNAMSTVDAIMGDEEDYRTRGEESDGFYLGGEGQWDPTILRLLTKEGRPAITLNKVKRIVNAPYGFEQQNPTQIKYAPTEYGDQVIADILTGLSFWACNINDYKVEKGESFIDELITGRGNILVDIEGPTLKNGKLVIDEKNIEGYPVLDHYPWQHVGYGPHDKKTCKDLECAYVSEWISVDKLKKLAPTKWEEVCDIDFFSGGNAWKSNIVYDRDKLYPASEKLFTKNKYYVDKKAKKIKFFKVWQKDYDFKNFIYDLDSEFEICTDDYNLTDKEKTDLLSIDGFDEVTKSDECVWQIEYACNVFIGARKLEYTNPLTGELIRRRRIPIVPCYKTKRGDKIQGIVDDIKDPQREKNHRRTKLADQSNRSGRVMFTTANTFDEQYNTMEEAEDMLSRDGSIIVLNEGEEKPVVEKGIQIDSYLVALDQQADKDMEEISSVNPEMAGFQSDATSKLLYEERRNAALLGLEDAFNGLAIMQKNIGLILLEIFPVIMTPERVYRILNSVNQNKQYPAVELDGKPFQNYTIEQISEIWKGADLSQYDVAVTEVADSPTKRQHDFRVWSEIAQGANDPIVLEFLLELSDLPPNQKESLRQVVQRGMQQRAQSEQLKSQTEIQKTLIANQGAGGGMPQEQMPPAQM